MRFLPTEIPDVIEVVPKVFEDARGFFMETYRQDLFLQHGIAAEFVQDNHSASERGVLRGLHYQIEHSQGKLVRVIVGEVYDVAVDLRRSSRTFGRWVARHLSAEQKNQVWIPGGFAHGFYVLSARAEMNYRATDYYAPQCERTLLWNDPAIGIPWPVPDAQSPILSPKDAAGKLLSEAETYA
jgi:dTDP-4-dehydrorhamnose 3,5-epimerase